MEKIVKSSRSLLRKPSCTKDIGREEAMKMLTRNGFDGQGGAFSRISVCLPVWRCCGFMRQNIRI